MKIRSCGTIGQAPSGFLSDHNITMKVSTRPYVYLHPIKKADVDYHLCSYKLSLQLTSLLQ